MRCFAAVWPGWRWLWWWRCQSVFVSYQTHVRWCWRMVSGAETMWYILCSARQVSLEHQLPEYIGGDVQYEAKHLVTKLQNKSVATIHAPWISCSISGNKPSVTNQNKQRYGGPTILWLDSIARRAFIVSQTYFSNAADDSSVFGFVCICAGVWFVVTV